MNCLFLVAALAFVQPGPILWSTAVSPDGLVAVSGLPTQWLYDAETLEPDVRGEAMPAASASAVDFHPSGRLLAAAGAPAITGIYDLGSGVFTQLAADEGARGVAFNHDGTLVALAEHSGTLTAWTIGPDPSVVYRHHPEDGKSLTGVAWRPAHNTLISIGEFVTIHKLGGGASDEPVVIAHRPDVAGHCLLLGVDWHPDGTSFLVSDYGNHDTNDPPSIQIRALDGTLIRSIEREGAEFRNVRWNPAGTMFAATSDSLLIYGADGELLHETKVNTNLWGLAWSPGGDAIFTTDEVGRAMRWNADASGPMPFGR